MPRLPVGWGFLLSYWWSLGLEAHRVPLNPSSAAERLNVSDSQLPPLSESGSHRCLTLGALGIRKGDRRRPDAWWALGKFALPGMVEIFCLWRFTLNFCPCKIYSMGTFESLQGLMRSPGMPKPVPGERTNERAVGDVTDPSVAIQKCLGNISILMQDDVGPSHVREDVPHDDTSIVHGRPSTNPIHSQWHGSVSVWWTPELRRWKGASGGGKEKSIEQTTYNKGMDAQLFAQSIRKYCDILLLKMPLKTLYICVQPYISSIIT